ncbi:MAG: hemerythrin domain-containing protein [Candidatus Marinimicrobia bacterium]|nr:hemerythrin domain-containing protein [Candidatus Neomarinimicrobiota bacterium]
MAADSQSTTLTKNKAAEILRTLPAGHVIHTMVTEHVKILGFLRKLDELKGTLQLHKSADEGISVIEDIGRLAQNLIDAEPHHAREEKVLFPRLVGRGTSGPPHAMLQEHVLLRKLKQRLFDLASYEAKSTTFQARRKAIIEVIDRLVPNLALHISKEDNVLYPMALEVIDDPLIWDQMKLQCDDIGYCSFTTD